MKRVIFISAILAICMCVNLNAQTVYVDAAKGSDASAGTKTSPVATIEKANELLNGFAGKQQLTIKLEPGLYVLNHKIAIGSGNGMVDTLNYSIQADIMPDDTNWQPGKMPVIVSVSANNSTVQFTHCVGFLVAKNNVSFKGLKFVGNASPGVEYYYPITRENENLDGLQISQCYFIGEKNSSRIQSGAWAHGAGIRVDHTIFYNCRNALVLINSIKGFSITNSIIYGAYESGIWFGDSKEPFVFNNNIVTHCSFVWVRPQNTQQNYTFANSLITENDNYLGFIAQELIPAATDNLNEIDVRKSGRVVLSEVKTRGLPFDYLNPVPGTDGADLNAGIFINRK